MDSSTTEKLKAEVKDALAKGKLSEALEKVKQCLSDVENIPLNIAITGESGSGKSTFINSIRGVDDENEGAAQTGVVETTMEPTPYCHPKYNSIKYWDLPGTGTPNFKAGDYLKKVKFDRYDFFIIITSERFKENDILLAQEIQRMKKKFYFVRSKIDRSVNETRMRKPKTFNEKAILDSIREDCVNSLKKGGIQDITDDAVFLVSSFELEKFDLTPLLQRFEEEIPSHKRYVYLCALPNVSSDAIGMKRQALESSIPWVAVQAAVLSAVPGLSDVNEFTSLTYRVTGYLESFGLDEKSLKDLEERSGKSNLKRLMKSPFVSNEVTYDLVRSELKKRNGGTYMAIKSILSWIPAVSLVSGTMSASVCIEFLYSALNEIANDAKTALNAAFGDLDI